MNTNAVSRCAKVIEVDPPVTALVATEYGEEAEPMAQEQLYDDLAEDMPTDCCSCPILF